MCFGFPCEKEGIINYFSLTHSEREMVYLSKLLSLVAACYTMQPTGIKSRVIKTSHDDSSLSLTARS
jgi:hypothetical protein